MRFALALVMIPAIAAAQTATGRLEGTVIDDKSSAPLTGATVIAQSAVAAEQQVVLTDEHGAYELVDLAPGAYTVTVYYAQNQKTFDVVVQASSTTTAPPLPIASADAETITIAPCYDCDRPRTGPVFPVESPIRARPQVQADLGLAVIGLAYEQPIGQHYAVQLEAQAFSTYFAPWFSAGDRVDGFGGQLRPTWFRNADHHGLYVAPYVRIDRVTHDMAAGVGFAAGGFAGYAFGAGPLDIRIGGGAQYMRYFAGPFGLSTPFVALDLVVGYRL